MVGSESSFLLKNGAWGDFQGYKEVNRSLHLETSARFFYKLTTVSSKWNFLWETVVFNVSHLERKLEKFHWKDQSILIFLSFFNLPDGTGAR